MNKTQIQVNSTLTPKIYAYTLPEVPVKDGWIKIGYTTRGAEERIKEQIRTVDLETKLLWHYDARFQQGGEYFTDHDFHGYLKKKGIERKQEWFYFDGTPERAKEYFKEFVFHEADNLQRKGNTSYTLRHEQAQAVAKTKDYFANYEASEFLWNAKPRFGKTLSTYDLICQMKASHVLIVTNRPAIANAWYDDFNKFIGWQTSYLFVSESDALKDRPTLSRHEFLNTIADGREYDGQIVFLSLQDLKGSKYFGGIHDKLKWVHDMEWDLLVIDEAHEAVDTFKTDEAFHELKRKHTLHLSGTPFKALASDKFTEEQIYTWSYEDEQEAKLSWNVEQGTNPYENLPTLNLFTYQLSPMVVEQVNQGMEIDEEQVEFTFDLNEFFSTNASGKFVYEAEVMKFLDRLTENEKYPFSTEELRHELKHTFWLLHRVASAKAMEKLLQEHPVFSSYHVIIAAGDGKSEREEAIDFVGNEKSLDTVKKVIAKHDKTITLSVGQLTTGVTVPEWSAVMMLSNIKSPSLYMQAAFRSQNPFQFEEDGQLKRKENAYVFDFAPERTLILFDEFANNLKSSTSQGGGTTEERQENIKQLLNFFPVIAEDEEGKMTLLDAKRVMTIPSQLKAREVVKRGFMSNFLFANVSGIFGAPQIVLDTLQKLKKPEVRVNPRPIDPSSVKIDKQTGEVEVDRDIVINKTKAIFGKKKIVEVAKAGIEEEIKFDDFKPQTVIKNVTKKVVEAVTPSLEVMKEHFTDVKKSDEKQIQKELATKVEQQMRTAVLDYGQKKREVEHDYAEKIKEAKATFDTKKEEALQQEQKQVVEEINEQFKVTVEAVVEKTAEEIPEEIVHQQEKKQEERKKQSIEEDVRDHLRGFTRSIPSFLMAYGDDDLTLMNFDDYTPDHVFQEVTGITEDDFRFLRDGGERVDTNTGEMVTFAGGFFDEMVFNQSVREFLNKKRVLANYFDEEQTEDIFDYIPPQRTNQIFTPKRVVKMMVDMLEKENPDIFTCKDTTFIDLYTKSGLFLTEIVKKLHIGLKNVIPDEGERIRHILERQVYAVAPTEIIRKIAENFIFGEFTGISRDNVKTYDLTEDAKKGTVGEKLDELYGGEGVKFDVVVGNPPYQEETRDTSNNPVYNFFMDSAYELSDKVLLITPARFLFNAGKTSKAWNGKMLNDIHLKVSQYWQDSTVVFPNTDIKGGVAVTFRDKSREFERIGVFTAFSELNSILKKVEKHKDFEPLSPIIYSPESYRLTDDLHRDYPEAKEQLSKGHHYSVTTNIFEKLPHIFTDDKRDEDSIQVFGRENNERVYKWVKRDYILEPGNLLKWKVMIPKSNGTGAIGEVLSTPLIGEPLIGHTQSFISLGEYDVEAEAANLLKYVKTKFARAMLGVLKITQDNKARTWAKVPLQDFTQESDINWSRSIPEIDQQLYKKYGLDEQEVAFIEEKVRAME